MPVKSTATLQWPLSYREPLVWDGGRYWKCTSNTYAGNAIISIISCRSAFSKIRGRQLNAFKSQRIRLCTFWTMKGGQPSRRIARGCTMGTSIIIVLTHVKEKAPTAVAAGKHSPTEETTQSAQFRACDNVLHCPLMLSCADCLHLTLQHTGRVVCVDCWAHHQLTISVIRPPPLLLDLLADQVT